MTEKVVGTTFVQQPNIEDLQGEYIESSKTSRGMAELRTRAQLIRDPENPYDPTAVGYMYVISLVHNIVLATWRAHQR